MVSCGFLQGKRSAVDNGSLSRGNARDETARNKLWLFLFFQWHNQNRCNTKREVRYEP
ncbi:hypothetical protein L902_09535 [Agrobacterium radiobacter DSM 30147]|nr:hypothetical protein L902_09535 [Agrobacterium radiobacter DSM 30147]